MRARRGIAGFTLFEALVSVALMGLIVASLSAVTGQWLPNWRHGFGRVQSLEQLDVGLQRLIDDLEAAEFVTPNSQSKSSLFIGDGSSVTLVRAAIGPDARPHLEVVRLEETSDDRGVVLVRSRTPFTPLVPNLSTTSQLRFADPVALVRAPFRVSFAFAGTDRIWRDAWRDSTMLPAAVRIRLRDATSGQILSVSTAALLHVDVFAQCIGQKSIQQCLAGVNAPDSKPSAPTTTSNER